MFFLLFFLCTSDHKCDHKMPTATSVPAKEDGGETAISLFSALCPRFCKRPCKLLTLSSIKCSRFVRCTEGDGEKEEEEEEEVVFCLIDAG